MLSYVVYLTCNYSFIFNGLLSLVSSASKILLDVELYRYEVE